MFILLVTIATSFAETVYTGIPVEGIEGLSAPIFQTAETGWWAQIPRGSVQVFVADTNEGAVVWVEKMKEKMEKYKPLINDDYVSETAASEAFGDGIGLLIARDSNVAYMVRHDGQATEWARSLQRSIVAEPRPPLPPVTFQKADSEWVVDAPDGTVHLAFKGGVTAESPKLRFSEPPEYVVIWDAWGRAVTSSFHTEGQRAAAIPIP